MKIINSLIFVFALATVSSCGTTNTISTPSQATLAVDEKVDSQDLERFLTVKGDYLKIPLTKMASGHLHLKATLNGVEGEFILDTGAGATVIETKRKEKFSLKTEVKENQAVGAGGSTNLQTSLNNNLKIGALEKPAFTAYVMSLDHVNRALNAMGMKEVDGVIGADILSSNHGIIDYAKLVLYLRK